MRAFIVMVQRGRDQLVDILLIGWWGGKWASASSTFWFQLVWGLRACGQHAVNFSHLVGFQCCHPKAGGEVKSSSSDVEGSPSRCAVYD